MQYLNIYKLSNFLFGHVKAMSSLTWRTLNKSTVGQSWVQFLWVYPSVPGPTSHPMCPGCACASLQTGVDLVHHSPALWFINLVHGVGCLLKAFMDGAALID